MQQAFPYIRVSIMYRAWIFSFVASLAIATAQAGQSSRTWVLTTEGDYVWRYIDGAGVEQQYVFVPPTKIVPVIRVSVTPDPEGMYDYAYTLGNGPSAVQKLHSLIINISTPALIDGTPRDWVSLPPVERMVESAAWYKRTPTGFERGGIPPGESTAGFSLRSPNLPGVTEVRTAGNVLPPAIPDGMPSQVFAEVNRVQEEHVGVRRDTIGPLFSLQKEPLDSVLNRVRGNYRRGFLQSAHPRRQAIVGGLTEAATAIKMGDRNAVRATLARVRQMAGMPTDDPWGNELAAGLSLCIETILERLKRTP